jgi:hypothetical protein
MSKETGPPPEEMGLNDEEQHPGWATEKDELVTDPAEVEKMSVIYTGVTRRQSLENKLSDVLSELKESGGLTRQELWDRGLYRSGRDPKPDTITT